MVKMNEIKQKAERAKHWRNILDQCGVKHQWEWCLYVGLCETSTWTNRVEPDNIFRWSR